MSRSVMIDSNTIGIASIVMLGRFGILTFAVAPFATLEREWRWAEDLGFDYAWLPDTWSIKGYFDLEPWTLLAALARATSRLRMGTLVTTIIARHPALTAAQALTIDHLSEGRVELGIGVGDRPADCDVFGVPRWPPAERVARLEEQLVLLDRLLRGEAVSREGTYYSVRTAPFLQPAQRPRPPLVVAAEGRQALALVARYADAWSTIGGYQPTVWAGGTGQAFSEAEALNSTRVRVEQLSHHCIELGRDPARLRRSVLAYGQAVDPLSSLDAFDHFVGSYTEVGMREFVFYWPPLANVTAGRPITAEQRATVEQIARARLAAPSPGD
jgi:alkanesulfonate monooxygenase SsuD/methylene tetrahydromethanopterin reductase-like flavin-dependent oxidoreductase (luciferase family)